MHDEIREGPEAIYLWGAALLGGALFILFVASQECRNALEAIDAARAGEANAWREVALLPLEAAGQLLGWYIWLKMARAAWWGLSDDWGGRRIRRDHFWAATRYPLSFSREKIERLVEEAPRPISDEDHAPTPP